MTHDLPPGWARTTLEEIASWGSGGTPKRSEQRYYGGEIPWAVIGDLNDGKVMTCSNFITGEGLDNSSCKVIEPGTVLIAMYGSIGKLGIAGMQMATNQAIAFADPHIDHNYLFYYLQSQRHALSVAGKGATQRNISQTVLKAWPIPVAPSAEQERIVAAIEEHFSRLDAVEHDITTARAKGATLPSVVLPGLFSTDWPTRRIGELARVGSGATPRRSEARYWSGGTIPWVTSGAVNERAIISASGLVTEEALAETSVKLWPIGTVLVAMYGEGKTRGKAALLQLESTCNQACAAIDYDRSLVTGDYLLTYLNSQYEASRRLASGGVQPNLSLGLVKAMEIPIPSLETQRSVALQAEDIVLASEQLAATCTKARQHVTALRQSILAAAFSGQLVPQDPSDEHASLLLERIAASRATKPNRCASARQMS